MKQDEALFRESFEKYNAALAIKPDAHEALNNWGGALLQCWRLTGEPALWDEAKAQLDRAETLDSGAAYNGACLAAIRDDLAGCAERLKRCLAAGTLPDADYLLADDDLESVRGLEWFKDIVSRRIGD